MYQKPTPVAPANLELVLDAAQGGDMAQALTNAGAVNAQPPLPHSSHLKNIKTGIVFPYMERMAQMRDCMVNCDQYGNTDPAAWQPTVIDSVEYYDPKEQAVLMQQAIVQMDQRLVEAQAATPVVNNPEDRKLPYGAEFFDRHEMTQTSEQVIDQLSALL